MFCKNYVECKTRHSDHQMLNCAQFQNTIPDSKMLNLENYDEIFHIHRNCGDIRNDGTCRQTRHTENCYKKRCQDTKRNSREEIKKVLQQNINTVKKIFPETVIQLCRFHFYQSVKRKLVNLFGKKFYEHKELKEVWTIIKGCSYFGWTRYPEMLENLKEHLRTKNMSFATFVWFTQSRPLYCTKQWRSRCNK